MLTRVDRPRLGVFILMPVLRDSALGDNPERAMTQRRAEILPASTTGGEAISFSTPVDAVADAVDLLVGLEVDVRRAAADRVEHDLVDELDDRRVVDVAPSSSSELGVAAGDLEALEIDAFLVAGSASRVSACSTALSMGRIVLDDTIVASTPRPVANDLVDRRDRGRVGTPRNSRLPRGTAAARGAGDPGLSEAEA